MAARRRPRARSRRSLVVVGASAGGVSALTRIFKDLPEHFPAAILVVLHVRRDGRSWLPEQLTRSGHLPVKLAEDGERCLQGRAYVAPAGTHLEIRKGRIVLGSGPEENYAQPSIDALFRSAAESFGDRTIGVVLTGMLRDGTAGLRMIQEAGGITIVEDPASAEHPDMPRNAMRNLPVDYCLDLSEIGPVLELMVRRTGSHSHRVLETGLASSLRLLKDRVRLFGKVYRQSRRNSKTRAFLKAAITALDRDVARIREMLPRN
jgi:two-component system, chemotaxis family, protein-glutamate methylesterase/glutaminase